VSDIRDGMQKLGMILGGVLALYLICGAVLFVVQRKIMYFPPAIYLAPTGVGLADIDEIYLEDENGVPLRFWWSPPQSDCPVILFFHGNASAVFSNIDIYRDLIAQGYGLLGVSYPGYPGAGGYASQKAITAAAHAQYDWLLTQNIPPEKIIFFGTSLGAAIAAQLSVTRPPALLILDAPFRSMLDMVRLRMPLYRFSIWLKDDYRTDIALRQAQMPILILHGTQDAVIPMEQSETLSRDFLGPYSRHVIDGGQHTNLWGLGGREIIEAALLHY